MRTLVGKIVCERVNVGFKSETDGYFLVMDDGHRQRISVNGEPPFYQKTLRTLVGKRCEASGDEFWGKFVAETIKEIK